MRPERLEGNAMNDEATLPVVVSVALIALAAAHIGEETVKGFRRFFNTEWFRGNENCPVSRAKGLFIDQIGLFLLLAGLAALGALLDSRWLLVALGIIIADLVQHAVFSIAKMKYTPGVATSTLYLLYVIYFFGREELRSHLYRDWAWVAVAVGAAFIAANYTIAKVQAGRCSPAGV